MLILVTPTFAKTVKKLALPQKKVLDKAVRAISEKPEIGEGKVGDLQGISIYKFRMHDQVWLLAYRLLSKNKIKLLLVGPHENFYRKLKKLT